MVLFVVTQNQDRSTRMASEHTVTALLAHESARLGTLALDYARWDAAVENLVIAFDETWADDNVGTYLAETYDISSSYVVNGRDDVVFAMAGNKILAPDQAPLGLGTIAPLVSATRGTSDESIPSKATTAMVEISGVLHIVAVSRISPEGTDQSPRSPDPGATLILTQRLDTTYLPLLAETLQLENVRLQGVDDPAPGAHINLVDISGRPIGTLSWVPARPGQDLRVVLLPSIAIVVLIMAALLAWWLNRVEATVRQLTNNNSTHTS